MSDSISHLDPQALWTHFTAINAIPRPSKREGKIVDYMVGYGNRLGLSTQKDKIGNVLIRKPASPGYQDRPVVVLQAHLDMVHQKNEHTDFDFEVEGISMFLEGDWVKAKGTTLGADNGLGVAAIMAVLESKIIRHPPLEALFTVDEETGMSGAKALSPSWLQGKILLNLDTEEDDELGVGCAGGIDVTGIGRYSPEQSGSESIGLRIGISGLKGGHSGMDIHLGLANANKVLVRLVWAAYQKFPVALSSMIGGSLRNAIPREASAILAVSSTAVSDIEAFLVNECKLLVSEFESVDPEISLVVEACPCPDLVLKDFDLATLLHSLYAVPNGVAYMSASFPGQTETSNNLATVKVASGEIRIGCLTRSSVEPRKRDLVQMLASVFTLAGYRTETGGDYSGWQPNPQSQILMLAKARYEALFGSSPRILAGHGGLECGIIGAHYPGMDMISLGPTILGAHSPDERASVSSAQKFWRQLTDLLAHIE